ncbi:hypothetical protein BaRGS_00026869 [Batillaria attramentaria]|uniref:EF-hand domain-containing protein n=1 Tax=Batillaria attramentaria TaxID=370345 RepID=A0ABD0K4P5_9CAEN
MKVKLRQYSDYPMTLCVYGFSVDSISSLVLEYALTLGFANGNISATRPAATYGLDGIVDGLIKVLDASSDGVLSEAEFIALAGSGGLSADAAVARIGLSKESAEGLFLAYDADKDGKLAAAELSTLFSTINADGMKWFCCILRGESVCKERKGQPCFSQSRMALFFLCSLYSVSFPPVLPELLSRFMEFSAFIGKAQKVPII